MFYFHSLYVAVQHSQHHLLKIQSFTLVHFCLLCHRLIGHMCGVYFWALQSLLMIYVSIFMPASCCFDDCRFVPYSEFREHDTSSFVLFSQHWFGWSGFLGWLSSKETACDAGDAGEASSIPGLRRFPWRRTWHSTPVFFLGKTHEQRFLVGYSPHGCKVSNTTEETEHTNYILHLIFFCFLFCP